MVSDIFHNSFISRNHNELLYLLENIEEVLSTHFYSNQMKRESVRFLRKTVKKKNKLSKNQKRFLKFFFAFVFFFLLIIIWFYFTQQLVIDSCVFPILRGLFLFILYIWLLAWNVYVWNNNYINYRIIFKFNYHYSTIA